MGWMFDNVERLIARPQKPANHCEPLISDDAARALRDTLRPGDVLLIHVRFRGQSGHPSNLAKCPLMMLWTAPTLRHRSAIGWLRRNEPH